MDLFISMVIMLMQIFTLLIVARVLLSWVQLDPYHPVVRFIYETTEPFLKPVRDFLPPAAGFDFSPMVVLILAQVISRILINAVS